MSKRVTPWIEATQKKSKSTSEKQYSFFADAWKRLKRNRTAIIGLVIIVFLVLVAVFADLIAPYDYKETDVRSAYLTPSAEHPFGTDNLGRDIFSRCVYAARVSLPIGIVCMIGALIVGGGLGLLAGFFGKGCDTVIMRVMDVFQSIPSTLMAITVVASLGTGIAQLIAAICISFLPAMSKVVRAAVFTVRGNEYIEAAQSIGASNLRIMLKYVVPNALGHMIIFAVSTVSIAIMTVATLSYIGLGVPSPTPDWGAMLSTGKSFISGYPHMVLFPGLMIMITILGFNLFGDGLRDALDPRLK